MSAVRRTWRALDKGNRVGESTWLSQRDFPRGWPSRFAWLRKWLTICFLNFYMQALRILMLLVTLAVGYVLFFRSQPASSDLPPDLAKPPGTTVSTEAATPAPRTQYREAMNRAQAVAKQMQDERKEADSY